MVNPWLFPTTLFLISLTVWVLAFIFARRDVLGIVNIGSGILSLASILLLWERQYVALAAFLLCVTLLVVISNIGLTISWQNQIVPQGPFMNLVGKDGVVVIPLSPKGQIKIGDQIIAATSEGLFIPEGQKIRVIRGGTKLLVVEKLE